MLELHQQGLSRGEIADAVGIAPNSVSRIKKELGIQRPRVKLTAPVKAEVCYLLREGLSTNAIARRVGLAPSTIGLFLRCDNSLSPVEAMLSKPVNQFLIRPWTKAVRIDAVAVALAGGANNHNGGGEHAS